MAQWWGESLSCTFLMDPPCGIQYGLELNPLCGGYGNQEGLHLLHHMQAEMACWG